MDAGSIQPNREEHGSKKVRAGGQVDRGNAATMPRRYPSPFLAGAFMLVVRYPSKAGVSQAV